MQFDRMVWRDGAVKLYGLAGRCSSAIRLKGTVQFGDTV